MKGLNKDTLIKILEKHDYDVYFEDDLKQIFKLFGDDYFVNRDTGVLELCNKNNNYRI